jgi:16S rRNA (cytosine1402-N4)-methyltransferase
MPDSSDDPGTSIHVPVMPAECLEWLAIRTGAVIVDGTLGGGGHTRLIAGAVGPTGRVIGIDRDEAAIARAEQAGLGDNVTLLQANYGKLPAVLEHLGLGPVDGLLLDLGLSSDQLADVSRGFSYGAEGDLDLRFDRDGGEPAWQLLKRLPEQELADLIYCYGEERFSRRIARAVCEQRASRPLRSASEVAALVRRCVPRSRGHDIDPATRTFQALRIAVNDELGWLERLVQVAADVLKPGGRLVVMSFHSLEDRIVKHGLRDEPRLEVLTKKPVLPGDAEQRSNPRSRSAKLRVAQRIEA